MTSLFTLLIIASLAVYAFAALAAVVTWGVIALCRSLHRLLTSRRREG